MIPKATTRRANATTWRGVWTHTRSECVPVVLGLANQPLQQASTERHQRERRVVRMRSKGVLRICCRRVGGTRGAQGRGQRMPTIGDGASSLVCGLEGKAYELKLQQWGVSIDTKESTPDTAASVGRYCTAFRPSFLPRRRTRRGARAVDTGPEESRIPVCLSLMQ